ncbi:hypothetical protein ScPMuIL_010499 [Solemya velum]
MFILDTDASDFAIGAELSQLQAGNERTIHILSQPLFLIFKQKMSTQDGRASSSGDQEGQQSTSVKEQLSSHQLCIQEVSGSKEGAQQMEEGGTMSQLPFWITEEVEKGRDFKECLAAWLEIKKVEREDRAEQREAEQRNQEHEIRLREFEIREKELGLGEQRNVTGAEDIDHKAFDDLGINPVSIETDMGQSSSTMGGLPPITRQLNTPQNTQDDGYRTEGRGFLLILDFYGPDRDGNADDVRRMRTFFEQTLNFEVDNWRNTSLSRLQNKLEKLMEKFTSTNDYYCFVCAIMSHGDENGILTQDYRHITLAAIMEYFNNAQIPSFGGRPRVYIVQACRGLRYQEGVATDSEPYSEDRSLASVDIKVPKDSDTLIAHSTIEGHVSFRSSRQGSWFVQTLMDIIENHYRTKHLEDMLIDVRRQMATLCTWPNHYKQMSCTWSTLRKRLYFKH